MPALPLQHVRECLLRYIFLTLKHEHLFPPAHLRDSFSPCLSPHPFSRATVVFDSVAKFRDACLPQQIFDQHVRAYPRINTTRGQQTAYVAPLCFEPPGSSSNSNISSNPSNSSSVSGSPPVVQTGSNSTSGVGSGLVCMDETLVGAWGRARVHGAGPGCMGQGPEVLEDSGLTPTGDRGGIRFRFWIVCIGICWW